MFPVKLRPFACALLLAVQPVSLFSKPKIDGDWEGALQDGKLPMIFHLRLSGGSTADSPKQGVRGMPAFLSVTGKEVKISLPGGAAAFEGNLEGSHIVGTFTQSGIKFPLTLTKSSNHPH